LQSFARVFPYSIISRGRGIIMIRIKLREAAVKAGISQARLSRRADVDLRIIQRIYKDPYTNINLHTLDKLATALNINASTLIDSVTDIETP
jgi:transcriptional regulator with XRE-family HTH domain